MILTGMPDDSQTQAQFLEPHRKASCFFFLDLKLEYNVSTIHNLVSACFHTPLGKLLVNETL